jgi:ureidoacrylate peracid hydrolase
MKAPWPAPVKRLILAAQREAGMHTIAISPEAQAFAIRQRGGKLRMFETIELARTAHVVVDLQNGFMEPGAPVEVPCAREVVGDVNAISRAVRAGGGINVFLQMTADEGSLKSWSNWFKYFHTPESTVGMTEAFGRGQHHWRLWPELDVQDQDLKVEKTRFGAFVPGASSLHEELQARGIDTLIITGTLSNCCCESTARDAMQMNYKLIFVADANAAMSDEAHNGTLYNMTMLFADVLTTEETLEVIGRSAGALQAAE